METIKSTIEQFMKSLQVKSEKSSKDNPEELLKKVLTKKEFEHIKFNYFQKGILGLKVDSSVWLYYLNLQKQELLTRLNKEKSLVKEIHLRLGETAK